MGRAAAVRAATKSKTDAKKAKINAVYGKKIIMAVKQGGGPDTVSNTVLRDVIKAAKANNVPVDNIERAIKKASEPASGDFAESTFEAYGFGGASMIVNVLSDNPNRSTADVKSTVNKRGGKIAEQGSVLFMYDRKGKVEVPAKVEEEDLLEAAIEAGCEDMELLEVSWTGESQFEVLSFVRFYSLHEFYQGDEEGTSVIFTDPKEAGMMAEAVKSLGHDEMKVNLVWVTKAPIECTDEDFEKNMDIIDALEELDDVDSVEHNMSN